MQRGAQGGQDECELTDLRQREGALHGGLQRLAGKQESAGAEDGLPKHDGCDDAEDGDNILDDEVHIDHHAYRHEEDGTEEVLDRGDEVLYLLGLDSLGQDATHDEGAEGSGEAHS